MSTFDDTENDYILGLVNMSSGAIAKDFRNLCLRFFSDAQNKLYGRIQTMEKLCQGS